MSKLSDQTWIKVGDSWPLMYRMVLVATERFESSAPAINVGYMKFAAGDSECPYFVCPGAQLKFVAAYWCDCLGDDFAPPNWQMKQVKARTLDDALTNASRISHELPRLIQPEPTAYDMIALANEVYRLRAELEFQQKVRSGYYGDSNVKEQSK